MLAEVDAYLETSISSFSLSEGLGESVRYAVFGGGKRIRPILTMQCCEAVGGTASESLPAACAIELIHAFSLVHDDLPAMDDDDFRRGRPSLHKAADEATAILAGDLLNTLAMRVALRSKSKPLEITSEILLATQMMIEGQYLDISLDSSDDSCDLSQLEYVHARKTGALIVASCRCGALTAHASDKEFHALNEYGQLIGILFQAVDDLIDVTENSQHLGKTAGKDSKAGKTTYPSILGIDGTRARIAELESQAIQTLDFMGPNADPLRSLARYLAVRTK